MEKIKSEKKFWNHLSFDNQKLSFDNVNFVFNESEFEKISFGCIPDDISERYLAYFENNKLFIHSQIGGSCYYELPFEKVEKKIICNKIIKYSKFKPLETKEQTIDFLNSFFQYSIFNKTY